MVNSEHYVYALFDEKGMPFYIGKGRGSRYRHHLKRSHNKLVNAKIRSIRDKGCEPTAEILCWFAKEEDALEVEGFMINHYGIKIQGGILCNFEMNPRSPQSGKRKVAPSKKHKPVYHKGFIFPSRKMASEVTNTAMNTFTRQVHRRLTVYLDDPFFEDCLEDYSRYQEMEKKWIDHISKRHPNAKPIMVDGVRYDARDDAAEQTRYSLWYIKKCVNDPEINNIYYLDD